MFKSNIAPKEKKKVMGDINSYDGTRTAPCGFKTDHGVGFTAPIGKEKAGSGSCVPMKSEVKVYGVDK